MTAVILAILAFVSIALFGWVIAEWHEMNIKDVIKTISTKGFDAI